MNNGVSTSARRSNFYDVIVVGAGPAGLSAARTTARLGFSTLVLERLPDIGQSSRPCNALLAPVPGLLEGRRLLGDLFYPQLDLLIPLSLVVGYPRHHRFISPGGQELSVPFGRGDSSPVAAIDRVALLKLMAGQAEGAGADLRCATDVTGLLMESRRVVGVSTSSGEFRAPLVLVAEGASRRLSRQAGLYPAGPGGSYALILTREMLAPAVQRQDLGQVTTFGRRYTSAGSSFGTVVMPLPGHAAVTFTLLFAGPQQHLAHAPGFYLDEYITRDPRVRDLFAHAETVRESTCTVAIEGGPAHAAGDGFLSLGDAATPAGHIGLLPAMYLGRKAALVAAEALDQDDVSGQSLRMYERSYFRRVKATLAQERDLMLALAQTPDAEIDRLTSMLAGLPLAAPFFSGWQGQPWEAARWLAGRYPGRQPDLVQRMLEHEPIPASRWPVSVAAGHAIS